MTSLTVAQLAPVEQKRLAELEDVIERGIETFVEVGRALREVRDAKLYRASYDSFEAYCRERWGFSRQHAYRQIEAANVVEILSPTGDTPPSERQARELVPLVREDEAQAVEVWRELRARHGSSLNAEKVRMAVDERLRLERKISTLKSSKSVEWYTPSRYVEAAREVLVASTSIPHRRRKPTAWCGLARFTRRTATGWRNRGVDACT